MAFTELVAPVCRTSPRVSTKEPGTKSVGEHQSEVLAGLRERRSDLGWRRLGDGEREHRVQEEAGRRYGGDEEDDRDQDGPAEDVEGVPVQQVRLEPECR